MKMRSWPPTIQNLATLLVLGAAVRGIVIAHTGWDMDIATFASWSDTLWKVGPAQFYGTSQADYPPGFMYVLWFLRSMGPVTAFEVKAVACLGDLACAALIYGIVSRRWSSRWGLIAAGFVVFNPAFIYESANWGQVDSVPAALMLASLWCTWESLHFKGDCPWEPRAHLFILAWILLAASVFVKPTAILFVPLYFAWTFAVNMTWASVVIAKARRKRRIIATSFGIVLSLCLVYVFTLPFNVSDFSPIAQFWWLYEKYQSSADLYPYTSVDAFNAWLILMNDQFHLSDHNLLFGTPIVTWGIRLLFFWITIAVIGIFRRATFVALLESVFLTALAYFTLCTRMHERYIFDAVLFAIPLIAYRRRYIVAVIALTLSMLGNLIYATSILHQWDLTPDALPVLSQTCAILNISALVYTGYAYLSGNDWIQTRSFAFAKKFRVDFSQWSLHDLSYSIIRWVIFTFVWIPVTAIAHISRRRVQ